MSNNNISSVGNDLTIEQVPHDYYQLINESLEKKNFSLAKELLDRVPFDLIFFIREKWQIKIEWNCNKEAFNFLFTRASSNKNKIKALVTTLQDRDLFETLCKYGNYKQFKIIAKNSKRNIWFVKNRNCLIITLQNNNYQIAKELLAYIKDLKSIGFDEVRHQLHSINFLEWFCNKESNLNLLRIIQRDFPEINISKILLGQLNYFANNRGITTLSTLDCFKRIKRFFKLKDFGDDVGFLSLRESFNDPATFFYLYKNSDQEYVNRFSCSGNHLMELLNHVSSYKAIHRKVIKFLLKKNLKLIVQNEREEREEKEDKEEEI